MSVHPTKSALVEAAIQLLVELTADDLVGALGVRNIAARAGVSPGSIYHHFGSLEAFTEAVLERVFDPGVTDTSVITKQLEAVTASRLPVDVGLDLHRAEFERISNDPELRARMGLWALGGEAGQRAYGEFLKVIDERIGIYLDVLFRTWGREIRPPLDMPTLVATHVALVNSSVIRHLADPTRLDVERFARMALSVSQSALRLRGDSHTVDDRLAEMNYYPLDKRIGQELTPGRARTRARILDAAAELIGHKGYGNVTVTQIGRAADVATSTLYELFADRDAIAIGVLLTQAHDVLPRVISTLEDPDDARAGLTVIADFLVPRLACAVPYAQRLIASDNADDLILDEVERVMGDLLGDSGEDARDQARCLLISLISRLSRYPSGGTVTAVEYAVRRLPEASPEASTES